MKFKQDLTHMIDLILKGRKDLLHSEAPPALREVTKLPKITLPDIFGKPLNAENFAGKMVVVEFWATWCVPCRSTLEWLADLKHKHGDQLVVIALAVESPEEAVMSIARSLSKEFVWGIADGATAELFGNIRAVPTMFVFDKSGRSAKALYGAPPNMHKQVERILRSAIK